MHQQFGLVFCGGGAKGAYQIGAWKALRELKLDQNIAGVAGSSVGALNGFLFAMGDYDRAEAIWMKVSDDVFLQNDVRGSALFSRDGLKKILRTLDFNFLKRLEYPLYATVVNTTCNYKLEYIRVNNEVENCERYLLASSAIPGVYPDEYIKGNRYIDGGVKDNMPIQPLYQDGIQHLVVLSLDAKIDIGRIRSKFPKSKIDVMIPSKDLGGMIDGTLNFDKHLAKNNMDLGYRDGQCFLQKVFFPDEKRGDCGSMGLVNKLFDDNVGTRNIEIGKLLTAKAFSGTRFLEFIAKANLDNRFVTWDTPVILKELFWGTIHIFSDGWILQNNKTFRDQYRLVDNKGKQRAWITRGADILGALESYTMSV